MVTFAHGLRPRDAHQHSTDLTWGKGVVVGYDGSPDADLAVRWAAGLASATDEQLRVLVVAEPTDLGFSPAWTAATLERARAVAGEVTPEGSEWEIDHRVGTIEGVLVSATKRASVLVLGSRGHGAVSRALVGSVSSSVARHAHCPVVVVRPEQAPGSGRVVVGHDGTPSSRPALELACRFAAATSSRVTLVRVHPVAVTVPVDKHGNLPASLGRALRDEELMLQEAVLQAREAHPGVEIDAEVVPGDPGPALANASAHAALVVLGARHHPAIAETILGSVSRHVLQHSGCPVAIVR